MSTIKTYKKHDIFCNTTPMRIIRQLQQTHVLPPQQLDISEQKCSFGMCVSVIRQEIVRFFTPSPSPLHHSAIVLGSKRIRRFATQKRLRTQCSSVFIIYRVVLSRPAFKALQLYRLLTFRTNKATSTQYCLPAVTMALIILFYFSIRLNRTRVRVPLPVLRKKYTASLNNHGAFLNASNITQPLGTVLLSS